VSKEAEMSVTNASPELQRRLMRIIQQEDGDGLRQLVTVDYPQVLWWGQLYQKLSLGQRNWVLQQLVA
jgi:hypothetical protein